MAKGICRRRWWGERPREPILLSAFEFASRENSKKMVALRKEQAQNPVMAIQKKMTPEETREYIHSLRGKFKMMPEGKSFAEWWAEHKREEIELEERKFQRHMALGKKSSLTRLRSKLNRIKRTRLTK